MNVKNSEHIFLRKFSFYWNFPSIASEVTNLYTFTTFFFFWGENLEFIFTIILRVSKWHHAKISNFTVIFTTFTSSCWQRFSICMTLSFQSIILSYKMLIFTISHVAIVRNTTQDNLQELKWFFIICFIVTFKIDFCAKESFSVTNLIESWEKLCISLLLCGSWYRFLNYSINKTIFIETINVVKA